MTRKPDADRPPQIAADVGNARIKLGRFGPGDATDALPEPERTLQLTGDAPNLEAVGRWLEAAGGEALGWWIGSVNRPLATRLIDWLRTNRPGDAIVLLAAGDLPLRVDLPRPDMVGIDRLLDAVAANRLRAPDRAAVIVDVGSAITVDLVSAEGVFRGGAILPGLAMGARALHQFTDLLPRIAMDDLGAPPPALGTDTVAAMRSGLFWGAVGAVGRLIDELAQGADPEVFLTGGAGAAVAALLDHRARHVPQLTLAGIACVARHHHK